ncbi:MAG TPA: homoserine dehydrogenase, partial [Clostridia bacterium]|nr:homoserine dehydrogenase [Clostridia bacterium]
MKKIGVALLGLGTVGGGTYTILKEKREFFRAVEGVDIEVKYVVEKNLARCAAFGVPEEIVTCDIDKVVADPSVNIVAEFFGGIEPAKSFMLKALKNGKSVVTANKELFSKYWHVLEPV